MFWTLPLPFLPAQLSKIQSILHCFIWQAKKRCIKTFILHRPKAGWNGRSLVEPNSTFALVTNQKYCFHGRPNVQSWSNLVSKTTTETLSRYHNSCSQSLVLPFCHIQGTPFGSTTKNISSLSGTYNHRHLTAILGTCGHTNHCTPLPSLYLTLFPELCASYSISPSSFYKYLHIRHALQCLVFQESPFLAELLKLQNSPSSHCIGVSHLCHLLNVPLFNCKTASMISWESTLQFISIPQQWFSATRLTLKHSRCISHWESSQKILHKGYCTPDRLFYFLPE